MTGEYILVNGTSKATGGPFMRLDPGDLDNDAKKSCPDLIIMSKRLFNFVDSLTKGKNRIFSPHPIKNNKVIYSDHFAIRLTLKNIPRNSFKERIEPKI